MATEGLPLTLDHTKPFVKAVMDVALDPSSLETTANMLRQIESAHGIEFLHEFSSGSIISAGTFRPKRMPLQYEKILRLLSDKDAFQQHYEYIEDVDIDLTLHPFLSETQLIIQGIDFANEHFMLLADGTIHAWTQRAWGQELANWANATDWGPHFNKKGDRYTW